MAGPYQAGATLGEAIFGGGSQDAYDKALSNAYSDESARQKARRERSLALIDAAREEHIRGITPKLLERVTLGDPAADAELQARSLIGKINLRNLGEREQPHYTEAQNIRFEGLLGDTPDVGRANRATAFVEGEDYQPVRVLGGNFVADAATLGDLDVVPTPQTLAQIEATERRADAAVQKSLRAPGGRSVKPPSQAETELSNARAAIASGADPKAVAAMLRSRGFPAEAKKVYSP